MLPYTSSVAPGNFRGKLTLYIAVALFFASLRDKFCVARSSLIHSHGRQAAGLIFTYVVKCRPRVTSLRKFWRSEWRICLTPMFLQSRKSIRSRDLPVGICIFPRRRRGVPPWADGPGTCLEAPGHRPASFATTLRFAIFRTSVVSPLALFSIVIRSVVLGGGSPNGRGCMLPAPLGGGVNLINTLGADQHKVLRLIR